MMRGIAVIKPGATTGDIGHAIQTFVEAQHMSVVRDFCGHGLGKLFHDEPNIVHVGRPGEGIVLRPGMFFTVEPMINLGRPHVKVLSDGWTAVTRDRSLSAQFEHTIGVTGNGVEIFTTSPNGRDKPPYRSDRRVNLQHRLRTYQLHRCDNTIILNEHARSVGSSMSIASATMATNPAYPQARFGRGYAALSGSSRTAAGTFPRRRT